MPRTLLMLLVFAACAIAPLPAPAQTGLGRLADSLERLDTNFDAADKNRDGLLSMDEAKDGNVAFIVKNFDAIDTKHQGLVSKDEVHAYIKRLMMGRPPASSSSTR